jgi:cobalt-zinc-cadmium efflux system outer membrane protein
VGDLDEVRPVPDIETVVELGRQSPGILRWDAELARSQAALSLARARRVPDLRAGVGVRWEQYVDQTDYLVDLEIDLPLFDRKQGEIREARFNIARARAGRESAESLSAEGIAEFHFAVTESEARISTLGEEVVPAAAAAFEAIKLGFEREAEDLGDLIAARRDLARAELQYTDALVDYHLALTALEGVVGQSLTAPE